MASELADDRSGDSNASDYQMWRRWLMTAGVVLAPTILAAAMLAVVAGAASGSARHAHRANEAPAHAGGAVHTDVACEQCARGETAQLSPAAASASGGAALLLDTADFPPRWYCGNWSAVHGWVHIVSDVLIFGAYAAIPLALAYFVSRRKDAPFPKLFWLFCAFIFACGTGHLIEASIFWQPWYRLSGLTKATTAVVSWATVLVLVPILPKALALPGLAKVNADLEREVEVRKRAEKALEGTNQQLQHRHDELEQFIYTVSHDLKAPLVTTLGFVGMLKDELAASGTPQARDSMLRIERAAIRMGQTIDELLQLSRIGRVADQPEALDTAKLLGTIVEGLELQIQKAGATVAIEPDMPHVLMDERKFRQVLENLLTNAIRYGCPARGARIEVGSRRTADEVQFFVRDFGQGIAPQYREKIFELFQRLQTDQEGTGVGLAIVRRVAQVLGGRAWVESEPGQGTTFWFALPTSYEIQHDSRTSRSSIAASIVPMKRSEAELNGTEL